MENIISGKNLFEYLKKVNIFTIGNGVLGCETIKILALMGTSIKGNSKIIITGNDKIGISSLKW